MAKRYSDLAHYLYERQRAGRPLRKVDLARELGVCPSKLTALLSPADYRPAVDDTLAARIAGVLNQPCGYVRNLYRRAA